MTGDPLRILFTGYAPVHFLCFQPIYDRLRAMEGVVVDLSGGMRDEHAAETAHDTSALYKQFDVDRDRIFTVAQIEEMDYDLLFVANTKPIEPRSVKERIQLFHGISFRNRAVRKSGSTPPDHFFLVGRYMHRAFRFRKLIEPGDPRVAKIGFPKTDPLLDGSLDRNEILSGFGFDGYRPVVVYAPTGADDNSMVHMGEEVIRRLRDSGRFDLIVKPHDHSHDGVDWYRRLTPFEDDHTRVVRGEANVIPSLFVADLLITDASSVSMEYALLDRPIVFLDVPQMLLAELERKGGFLDLGTWGRQAGLLARDPVEAMEAVAESLDDPFRHASVRRKMVRDLFYNPGTSTDAAVNWLSNRFPHVNAPVAASLRSEP